MYVFFLNIRNYLFQLLTFLFSITFILRNKIFSYYAKILITFFYSKSQIWNSNFDYIINGIVNNHRCLRGYYT